MEEGGGADSAGWVGGTVNAKVSQGCLTRTLATEARCIEIMAPITCYEKNFHSARCGSITIPNQRSYLRESCKGQKKETVNSRTRSDGLSPSLSCRHWKSMFACGEAKKEELNVRRQRDITYRDE